MCRSRSGGLCSELAQSQTGGVCTGRNHSFDRRRTREVTAEGDSGMNEDIGVADSGVVMRRIRAARPWMMRMNADSAQ